MDVRFISPLMIPSDHRLLIVHMKSHISLYLPPRCPPQPLWLALKDPGTRREFNDELTMRLWNQTPGVDELRQAILQTADSVLPKLQRTKPKGPPWEEDAGVQNAREHLRVARKALVTDPHALDQEVVDSLEDQYKKAVEDYVNREMQTIANMGEHNRFRFVWRIIHKITGKKCSNSLRLPGSTPDERVKAAMTFFQELLSPAQPMPARTSSPTQASTTPASLHTRGPPMQQPPNSAFVVKEISNMEIMHRAWRMNGYKAPGKDTIPMVCYRIPQVARHTARHMNQVMREHQLPSDAWTESVIVPVPKKPGATTLDAHRGISLINSAPKLLNRILLARFQVQVDPCLRDEQNGFRAKRSTIHHVVTLRRVMEEAKAHRLEAHFIFVDFKKAFDSVDRGKLAAILEDYGIPQDLREAVCTMYRCTKATVRTPFGLSPTFETSAGVMQGDSLSPFIFVLFMDQIIRRAIPDDNLGFLLERRRSSRHPEKRLAVLIYADDIVLVSSTHKGAQHMLTRLEEEATELGLVVNTAKTKSISINALPGPPFVTATGAIENCPSFVYLGCVVPDSEEDMSRRKALAWAAMGKLRPLLQAPLQIPVKVKLFTMLVETVLLYGGETCTMTKNMEKRLNNAHARLLRSTLGMSWPNHTTTEELYQIAGIQRPAHILRARRRALVQQATAPQPPLQQQLQHFRTVLLWCPLQHVGRPKHRMTTFVEVVEADADISRVSFEEWLQAS